MGLGNYPFWTVSWSHTLVLYILHVFLSQFCCIIMAVFEFDYCLVNFYNWRGFLNMTSKWRDHENVNCGAKKDIKIEYKVDIIKHLKNEKTVNIAFLGNPK